MKTVKCALCNEPVDLSDPKLWHGIEGFDRRRDQGGANQIVLRKIAIPRRFAHDLCVRVQRSGVNVNQGAML